MNRRRLAVVAFAGLLPWVIVTWRTGWYPLFSFGFAHVDPFSVTTLPGYVSRVGTVPDHLSAWPLATLLYAAGLAAAAFEDTDPVVVAGFLLLAALQVVVLAVEVSGQQNILAVPVGAVWLLLAAGWVVWNERSPVVSD